MELAKTKQEALERGDKYYFTGKACKRGHLEKRHISGNCTECSRQVARKNNIEKRDLLSEQRKAQRENAGAERLSKQRKAYRERCAERIKLYNRARHRRVSHATLPGFNHILMAIHRDCPEGYECDHIEPIKGKDRSGLNVPWNLQYLTSYENNKKSNRTDYQGDSIIPIDWQQYK